VPSVKTSGSGRSISPTQERESRCPDRPKNRSDGLANCREVSAIPTQTYETIYQCRLPADPNVTRGSSYLWQRAARFAIFGEKDAARTSPARRLANLVQRDQRGEFGVGVLPEPVAPLPDIPGVGVPPPEIPEPGSPAPLPVPVVPEVPAAPGPDVPPGLPGLIWPVCLHRLCLRRTASQLPLRPHLQHHRRRRHLGQRHSSRRRGRAQRRSPERFHF
jgi:hypothetical protein